MMPGMCTPEGTSPVLKKAPFEIKDLRCCERTSESNPKPNGYFLQKPNNGSQHTMKEDATSTASIRFNDNSSSVIRTGVCGPCGCAVTG